MMIEAERELTYLGDKVSAGGGCEAAVTARTKCGWVELRECIELLYSRFPLNPKGFLHKSYVRPAILYVSEAQPKDRKRYKELMLMLGLNETRDQLAVFIDMVMC